MGRGGAARYFQTGVSTVPLTAHKIRAGLCRGCRPGGPPPRGFCYGSEFARDTSGSPLALGFGLWVRLVGRSRSLGACSFVAAAGARRGRGTRGRWSTSRSGLCMATAVTLTN